MSNRKGLYITHTNDGEIERWKLGSLLHRLDGPAVISAYHEQWYKFGRLHRKDGPAETFYNENLKRWYCNGKPHRLDGPAMESDFDKRWFVDGIYHREDGPAIWSKGRYDGVEAWHWIVNGKPHRLDGPAVLIYTSPPLVKWMVYGKELSFESFKTVAKLDNNQILCMMLQYGLTKEDLSPPFKKEDCNSTDKF